MSEPALQLSEDQSSALVALSNTKELYCLKGYAGTGKTTVITYWIKNERPKGRIVLTAPTNKAANVLKDKAKETGILFKVDISTIHSLLSLKMKWEEDKQVLVHDPKGEDKFAEYTWVVIDECSMLNRELMEFIYSAQQDAGNKIIFMGDPCQLPPIGETESGSFQVVPQSELTQVKRQGEGNKILELATYIRGLILSDRPHYPNKIFEFVDDHNVFYHPLAKYESNIMEAFQEANSPSSGRDIRHLAWTNKVVDSWNDKIRDRLYGFDREDWTKGEQIVTTAPVINEQGDIVFTTDTLLKIEKEPELLDYKGVPCWKIEANNYTLYVLERTMGPRIFRKYKEELLVAARQDKKEWRKFYDFVQSFAYIKPAHSMTVHRSQGSTFDDVYVSFGNILVNPRRKESLQCLYVALTRPRDRVFLV